MKNLKYLLVGLVLVASTACDNYFFDNKLDHETVITEVRNFDYTLVDADYATIAKSDAAKAIAAKLDADAGGGTTYADALASIENQKYFNANAKARIYVPVLLPLLYPELDEGSICNVTYKVNKNDSETAIFELSAEWVSSIYFQEPFIGHGQGDFEILNIAMDGLSAIWTYDKSYGMKATGYSSGNKTTESWLISPELDIPADAEKPVLIFDQASRYAGTFENECLMYISTSYTKGAGAIDLSQWTALEFNKDKDGKYIVPDGSSWNFLSTGELDLSAYKGQKIYLGFRYTSSTAAAATWEIKNLFIREAE